MADKASALLVTKGLSASLGINIVLDDASTPITAEQQKTLSVLDLASLHKVSLHWVTSAGGAGGAGGAIVAAVAAPPKMVPRVPQPAPIVPAPVAVGGAAGAVGDSSEIKITIKTLTGRATEYRLSNTSSVSDLKKMVQQKDDVLAELQKLMFQNKKLDDEKPLSHYNIADNSTLFMIVGLKSTASYKMVPGTFLDPRYDYVYSSGDGNKVFNRGNRTFTRPYGWTKKALMVLGKYGNDAWVTGATQRQSDVSSVGGEWPVAYHGTKKEEAEKICKQGGVVRSRGVHFVPGKGIYTTPSPVLAEQQTDTFDFEGGKWKMIFMDRVQMEYTAEYQLAGAAGSYYITSNENSVRPYCILLKRV